MKKITLILIALGIIILAVVSRKTLNPKVQKKSTVSPTQTFLNETPTSLSEDQTPLSGGPTVAQITLMVTDPKNQSVVSSSPIVVKGQTVANAQVFVNDAETKADSSGYFSVSLSVDEGENEIIIVANNDEGEYTEQSLTITLETTN